MRKLFWLLSIPLLSSLALGQGGIIGSKAIIGPNGVIGPGVASGFSVNRVQSQPGSNGFGGTSVGTAFGSNMAAGNNAIACAIWLTNSGGGNTGITASFSDSQGKSYSTDSGTRKTTATTNYAEIGVECGHSTQNSTAAANTVTCTFSLSTAADFCWIMEASRAGGTLSLDQALTATNATGSPSAGPITPSQSHTLGVALTVNDDGTGSSGNFTAGSGWTIDQNSGGGKSSAASEYEALATTAAVTGNFTATNAGTWIASVANYKAS